jgi:NTE family protein
MRIGMALGGGGARGWAHIGALRTIIAAGFEPTIIAGTSVGAIVGGAYAAGKLDELEAFARSIDRRSVWRLADVNLGKGGGGLILGDKLASRLKDIIGDPAIRELPKKFSAVATELLTGHEIWIDDGKLIPAMRASYALPGIFVPAQLEEGRPLIDGGITNPVPVSACRAMGAQLVIAMPLPATQHPAARYARDEEAEASRWKRAVAAFREPERFVARQLFGDEPGALTTATVSVAALNILLDRMTRVRLASDPPDVTINSEIAKIALLEFDRADEAIAIGAAAAERALPEIEAQVSAAA